MIPLYMPSHALYPPRLLTKQNTVLLLQRPPNRGLTLGDPDPDRESLKAENDRLDATLDTQNLLRTTADFVPMVEQAGWSLLPNTEGNYAWHVQFNKVAQPAFARYTVEWRAGQPVDPQDAEEHGYGIGNGFLEALRPGDRVGLLMRAQYAGWENLLRHAAVRLVYDVR